MKKILLTLLVIGLFPGAAIASTLEEVESELHEMRIEIQMLKQEVASFRRGEKAGKKWGCYIHTDRTYYGTGYSEAEAKGEAMARCEAGGYACFSSGLTCSKGD
ncbi:MAG: hypothetical protein PHI11_10520 [Gallionella sp.]|nr:hypothetical protein [Gallionella sp.]